MGSATILCRVAGCLGISVWRLGEEMDELLTASAADLHFSANSVAIAMGLTYSQVQVWRRHGRLHQAFNQRLTELFG